MTPDIYSLLTDEEKALVERLRDAADFDERHALDNFPGLYAAAADMIEKMASERIPIYETNAAKREGE